MATRRGTQTKYSCAAAILAVTYRESPSYMPKFILTIKTKTMAKVKCFGLPARQWDSLILDLCVLDCPKSIGPARSGKKKSGKDPIRRRTSNYSSTVHLYLWPLYVLNLLSAYKKLIVLGQ